MPRRLLQPHSLLITLSIMVFIWLINLIRLNLHYLDPFNNGLKEYEITDIVSAELGSSEGFLEDRIVIVNSGRPDRARIARLVNRLDSAGAAVIGLDFYFDRFNAAPEDTLLQNSLKNSDRVVLACTLLDENPEDGLLEGVSGVDTFFSNHAAIGYGNFPSNSTKTIRVVSPREQINGREVPAFSTAILRRFDPETAARYLARNRKVEQIHFAGHKEDFISTNLSTLLDSLSFNEVAETYRDRIVLVGYAPEDPWANPLLDRHYSPINRSYANKSTPDMFGIVIHANVIQMVLNEKYVFTLPWWISTLLSVLICYLNVLLFRRIYHRFHEAFHGITRAIQLFEFIFLFFVVAVLFYYFRAKIDLGVGILAVLLAYDFIMIYESLVLPRVPALRRWSDTSARPTPEAEINASPEEE